MQRSYIDLNCDMGEGMPNDALIMPFISSANIACGGHAGDADSMQRTIELCLQHGVAIGAHPSFPDKANFGRTNMYMPLDVLEAELMGQLQAIKTICDRMGARLHHVKPHGALYNMAGTDASLGQLIATVVASFDASLIVYGGSGGRLIEAATAVGLRTASEVFADRTYQDDGSLTPRSMPNALIDDEQLSLQQVQQMVVHGTVTTVTGHSILIVADTICIHGDGPHAVAFATNIHHHLQEHHVNIRTI